MESRYDWKGFALEIDSKRTRKYIKSRRNICIKADATTFDYKKYLVNNNYPEIIDYLQVDIEPAFQSLNALLRLPLLDYRFRTITFEHDLYSDESNI